MNQQLAVKLGHLAHEIAAEQYRQLNNHTLIVDQHLELRSRKVHIGRRQMAKFIPATSRRPPVVQTGNHFSSQLDAYLATIQLMLQTSSSGGWWLEPSSPGISRRPDLADVERHHVWEVKPNNAKAIRAGRCQLDKFRRLLEQADREFQEFSKHARYRSDLGVRLCSRPWKNGLWCPQPEDVIGPDGKKYLMRFEVKEGLILWDASRL